MVASLTYIPKLDGLRAIAIGSVLISHFTLDTEIAKLGLGGFGVQLFFVISGYLITRIILDYRDAGLSTGEATFRFYRNRLLRLSPPYYFMIALGFALGIANFREDWWIYALYLTNFKIAIEQNFGLAGHFWSLAVEEQFYLLWFFVVLLVPRRRLMSIIVGGLFIGPAFRLVVLRHNHFAAVLLPSVVDFLFLGALIAIIQTDHPRHLDRLLRLPLLLPLAALLLTTAFYVMANSGDLPGRWRHAAMLGWLIASGLLVLAALQPKGGAWLAWPPIRHVGKISYGLYIYHLFVPLLTAALGIDLGTLPMLAIHVALSIAVAEVSWRLIERPFLAMKGLSGTSRRSREAAVPLKR